MRCGVARGVFASEAGEWSRRPGPGSAVCKEGLGFVAWSWQVAARDVSWDVGGLDGERITYGLEDTRATPCLPLDMHTVKD